jgi:hypothetical protein
MSRFRKKPVVIEATQFFAEQKPWPEGVYPCEAPNERGLPTIFTLEGPMRVSEGDWIITGVKGEKYACKPDIFEMTYEPA